MTVHQANRKELSMSAVVVLLLAILVVLLMWSDGVIQKEIAERDRQIDRDVNEDSAEIQRMVDGAQG